MAASAQTTGRNGEGAAAGAGAERAAGREHAEVGRLSIDTIRALSMDAVQKANAGHPGTAMALAPLGYTLFQRFLQHKPCRHRLARPRPLRAQLGACVRAAVLVAAPLRL